MSAIVAEQLKQHAQTDFLPLQGTDYVEFYVGNAKQAAHFYITAFGFQPLAYAGPETGLKDRASYAVRQNKLTLVLTTPLRSKNEMADHIYKHGDGVKFLALKVEDATNAWEETTQRGAKSYIAPVKLNDDAGELVMSGIHTYGDVVHLFIERKNYNGAFMPGYRAWSNPYFKTEETGLLYNGYVKFPINEPAEGKKKSQVEEYLDFYDGEGVQHVAMATNNIVETVTALRNRGVEFLRVPTTYYDDLLDRVGHIDEDLEPLKELGILVDRDEEGYLLQIFTKPVEDRPTLFFEIIQRKGAKSFGKGNFKALFEAIEREQEARGNL